MGTIVQSPPLVASQSVAWARDRDMRTEVRATRPCRDACVADDALVQAIGTGDRWAMRVLFDRHKNLRQGKSIAEIAELLRIPANTVKTRMLHARRRLAALVREKI